MNPLGLPSSQEIKSIACLMLGEIGDLLVTTPALKELRRRYPEAHITFILRASMKDLFIANPDVNELLLYDNKTLRSKAKFLATLWNKRFDLWLDLHTPTYYTLGVKHRIFRRNAFLMKLTRSRYRLGFEVPSLSLHLTHAVPIPEEIVLQNENIVHTTLRLLGISGATPFRKTLLIPEREKKWAEDFLIRKGIQNKKRIGLFFGAKQPADHWPNEHILEFIRLAHKALPEHFFIHIGGPHEQKMSAFLKQNLESGPASSMIDTVAETTLLQTAALLERCLAVLSTDSGPLHMAEAQSVPLVALFSSKNYLPIWKPLQNHSRILNVPVPCGPCFLSVCPKQNLCMNEIKPSRALDALLQMLS